MIISRGYIPQTMFPEKRISNVLKRNAKKGKDMSFTEYQFTNETLQLVQTHRLIKLQNAGFLRIANNSIRNYNSDTVVQQLTEHSWQNHLTKNEMKPVKRQTYSQLNNFRHRRKDRCDKKVMFRKRLASIYFCNHLIQRGNLAHPHTINTK